MNTIRQTVTITADRRLQLELALPSDIPVGEAELLIVLSPAQETTSAKSLQDFAGCLAQSATFSGDPVHLQRALRDEW